MPQNPARTARTRAEILDHAGRLFRLRGYAGTSIDDVMLAAGLTRGAFYAHFTSKDDLFTEAVIAGTGLRARLRGAAPAVVLKAYLDKAELVASAPTCVLAALPSDIAAQPCRRGSPTPTCSMRRSARSSARGSANWIAMRPWQ
jgi:TetR/AcrR family transcriptional repressor of nem operon